jgi:PAS domain S-box-containing protein
MNALPQEPVREREDLFRLLVEQVKDYAIFALDPSGIVVSWNRGAEQIKGYRAHEIVGHHFSRFYPEEAIRSGWPATELMHASRDGRFEDEGWRVRKDGTRFWANVIITALHDDTGELRGFAKVTRDMTDHKRMERLEADAQQMGEFVAMLAHELRNPLAPIATAATLATQSRDQPEKVDWALGVIRRQAEHLTRLVDDLLDVSRITRGRVRLERRRIRLGEALDRALDAIDPVCASKEHQLSVQRDADPLVRGDVVRVTQVITNLIGNACKYTRPKGRVSVLLTTREDRAILRVSDNGMGIAPDLLPRIFDLFTQDRRSLERSEGGLGLGLTIARRLVEMHGGTLHAASAGPGCGSEFTLELPLFHSADGEDSDRLCVLVVDDNKDAALTLQSLLQLQGHRCHVAFDGESAITTAQRMLPDVILLDIGLPLLDGYQTARRLRSLPELEGVTLVAITGYASDGDRREAYEAGFDLHLPKPVEFDDLVRQVPALAQRATPALARDR